MINLSLAIASLIGILLSPGRRILIHIIGAPLLQNLPAYQSRIHFALLDFILPAALIYLLMRLCKIDSLLKFNKQQNLLLAAGNILIIGYVAVRTGASTIEGGGAGFVVASTSPLILVPGIILLLIGISRTVKRSIKERERSSPSHPFSKQELTITMLAIVIPLAFTSTLYIGSDSIVMKARSADIVFNEKSKIAVEKLLAHPKVKVNGLYLDADGGPDFWEIKNGIYRVHGGSMLSPSLLNLGLLSYVEVVNRNQKTENNYRKYNRLRKSDRLKGEPIDELSSIYGLFAKNILSDEEKLLGIIGQEFTIVDLQTNETIATTTFIANTRNRRFAGHTTNGKFALLDFVTRALNLKRESETEGNEKTVKGNGSN